MKKIDFLFWYDNGACTVNGLGTYFAGNAVTDIM